MASPETSASDPKMVIPERDPKRELELKNMGVVEPTVACVVSQIEKLDGLKLVKNLAASARNKTFTQLDDTSGQEVFVFPSNSKLTGNEVAFQQNMQDGRIRKIFWFNTGGGSVEGYKNTQTSLVNFETHQETGDREISSGKTPASVSDKHIREHKAKIEAISPCFGTS